MPKRYPWPLTKLDRDIAAELFAEAKHSGRSLSSIVAEAVAEHFNAKLDEKTAAVSAPPAQPAQAA